MLKPGRMTHGHMSVAIGKGNSKCVHALVLSAFVGPQPAGFHTRHLNNQPGDNRLCNVIYGTPAENGHDRAKAGTAAAPKGESHRSARLTERSVRVIRGLHRIGFRRKRLSELFGVRADYINKIVSRKKWKHI